ncbi:GyrI-like domain-containing protein [Fulvivirga sediminis]|uniref:Effector binding domain-containing protein n=1 Tax=Fulvivirga sediminis TaxID=2803949 RepID=A0A937FA74_9BACT|nr:GyrI-like domain-containing protein [Fulvivirga sediminis]MBL3657124.1 effector binding domain-containing protein [Fulvivirga sediminis]
MNKIKIEPFKVMGIKVRTSNVTGNSAEDIGGLWQKFISENVAEKIPGRVDNEVLSIYTNYEGDHTKPYDTIIGCRVQSIDEVPDGMVSQAFEGGIYVKFVAEGNLDEGVIYDKWLEIWDIDLDRDFIADFEVFGNKAMNRENAKVDIYIGLSDQA